MSVDLFYRVQVVAGGADYDLSGDLESLTIEEDERKPSLLVVTLSDYYKVLGHALQEGMEVEVELGTVDDHSLVFRGRIHQVDASFPQDGVPVVRIRAHDNSMRMGLRRRNRPWTDITPSGIADRIAEEHGFLRRNVRLLGDPQLEGNGIRQRDETDLAFLRRLAANFGAQVHVVAKDADDEFTFLAQREIMTSDPEVTLHHGRCGVDHRLLTFEARADVAQVQLPRAFSGVDYDRGEAVEVLQAPVEEVGDTEDLYFDENMTAFRARDPGRAGALQALLGAAPSVRRTVIQELGEVERVKVPTFTSAEDLRTRSQNQFSTSIHGMRASGTTGGNHALRAQTNVRIEDVGGRFSGIWFLTQVRHVLDEQGYRTEFECRR